MLLLLNYCHEIFFLTNFYGERHIITIFSIRELRYKLDFRINPGPNAHKNKPTNHTSVINSG